MDIDHFLPLPHLPFHILLALSGGDAMHGWAVIKRIEKMTGGKTCPSTGSLYLAMGRLQERGLLEQAPTATTERDQRRKFHCLTTLGKRVLTAESERLAGLIEFARASGALGTAE
jgi:PadR family transcriptional regulator PadR